MPTTVPCGKYTVYYHQGFTGRAQGLELMLVASKANWARAPYRELGEDTCFAAPAIGHDQSGKIISQTPAAAQWLGTECGFAPAASLAAEAMKAALDIADLWAEACEARACPAQARLEHGHGIPRHSSWACLQLPQRARFDPRVCEPQMASARRLARGRRSRSSCQGAVPSFLASWRQRRQSMARERT